MKIVINTCFGGFSLSNKGLKRWAELKGKECYFFKGGLGKPLVPITLEEAEDEGMFVYAYDIPDPESLSGEDKDKHFLSHHDIKRDDPDLVKVVEELGGKHREGASGSYARLKIVTIPDGVNWEIDEYDGTESIHEAHRSWA